MILVASGWFAKANVRIVPGTKTTEIQVTRGAAYGLIGLVLGSGLVRTVSKALERAPELSTSG
jgi:hypothetical protein